MASGAQGPKQTRGYFVPVGNCANKILQYSGGAGAGGSFLPGSFAVADWASGGGKADPLLSTISTVGAGGLLRDMGKTVVSSNRTFRKIQLLSPSMNAGVVPGSVSGGSAAGPFLTGYIELASTATGAANAGAPVAYLPGLM